MRKIAFGIIFSVLCFSNLKSDPVEIKREDDRLSVSWKTPHGFTMRSVAAEEKDGVLALFRDAKCQEGLPTNLETWFANQHIARTTGPTTNAYHLYGVWSDLGGLVAAIHLGRMPVFGYSANSTYNPEEHKEILAHWVNMGVALQKDPEGGYEYANLERGLGGIATLMPAFIAESDLDLQKNVLADAAALVSELTQEDEKLPSERCVDKAEVEQVLPSWVFNLIAPEDPLRGAYSAAGFSVVEGEWVKKFYGKPRLIVEKSLLQN